MGKPTDPQTMEKVRALLESNVGVNEVARQLNMSKSTVSGLKKKFEADDSFVQIRTDKKQEFIEKAWEVAGKGIEIIKRRMEQISSDDEAIASTDMREVTTAVGTMIDKARLTAGESTQIVGGKVEITRFEDL